MFKFMRPLALSAMAICAAAATAAAQPAGGAPAPKASVVLVHGAFADGSSWSKVIPILEKQGLEVIAVQLPLTSLADDSAATARAVARAQAPVILVGHSWAGTVITQVGDTPKVRALVYVNAFANKPGQSVNDLSKPFPAAAGLGELVVDGQGFSHLSDRGIKTYFAPMSTPAEQAVIAAVQGPIHGPNFGEPVTSAAWQKKPSWFLVTEKDQMITPAMQEAMAKDIGAHVERVQSDHVSMVSHPNEVAKIILDAVAGQ